MIIRFDTQNGLAQDLSYTFTDPTDQMMEFFIYSNKARFSGYNGSPQTANIYETRVDSQYETIIPNLTLTGTVFAQTNEFTYTSLSPLSSKHPHLV
jgi:hypothetical protein